MNVFLHIRSQFRLFFSGAILIFVFPLLGQLNSDSNKVLGFKRVSISGMANFVTFYRDMSVTYPGTLSAGKNWAFTPYSNTNDFGGSYTQQPFFTLNLSAKPTPRTSFSVDYSLTQIFSPYDSTKTITAQNLFQFHGDIENKLGVFHLRAGGGNMNYTLSPLTFYNKDFREPEYERLPWEWRMNSFDIYDNSYHNSSATSISSMFNTAVQGFIFEGEDLPCQLGFSSFYGRSNTTLTPFRAFNDIPLQIMAGKLNKYFSRKEQVALNYYNQFGYTDGVNKIQDNRQILTGRYEVNYDKYTIEAELGVGKLNNPETNNEYGEAVNLTFRLLNEKKKLPLKVQYYRLSKNVAALESAVLNSNSTVHQGGYGSDRSYENSLYPAHLQEVNMIANNRQGLILNLDKSFDYLKFELGYALSQELENNFQGVSFQHMTNSFSRSRFQPWLMGVGPYTRVSNRFRRSFETISTIDSSSALKIFNAVDLKVKSKFKLFDRDLILMNFVYLGNVGNTISPFSQSYVSTFYEDFSAYYNVFKKVNVLLFYSFQNAKGGQETEKAINGKNLNQNSTGYGFGLDYDFYKKAGLYLRHRWMNHKDVNFLDDKFKGTETTIELKYYF